MTMQLYKTSINRFLLTFVLLMFTANTQAQTKDLPQKPLNQGQLEQILAPIALYPDSILSHILIAATYPLEVVQAERWTEQNPDIKGADAVAAVSDRDWDPSVQALVAFPQILKRMSHDLEWTQQLGDAFLADEEQVLAGVQTLRTLAAQAGSLDEMENVDVIVEDKTIIIEPREREIVYVPYYDTRVVYGPWRWRHYDPIFWDYPYYDRYGYGHGSYYSHNRRSSFYWGPRITLSFGFFSNSFHWRNRHLVRISPAHFQPRRYYNRHDILRHGSARRWVHNSVRRHESDGSPMVNRTFRSDNGNSLDRSQRRGERPRGQTRQQRVQERISAPRVDIARRNAVSPNFNQPSPTSTSTREPSNTRQTRNNELNELRHTNPRGVSRVIQRQRPNRSTQAGNSGFTGQQRPQSTQQVSRPSRPVTRSSPARQQVHNGPKPNRAQSNPVRQSRSGPRVESSKPSTQKNQSGSRRERGHIR